MAGHALMRTTRCWACKCGEVIKDPSAGRALARQVYRFHLMDVQMASLPLPKPGEAPMELRVTDPDRDAPDGSTIFIEEYNGMYSRHGNCWVRVADGYVA